MVIDAGSRRSSGLDAPSVWPDIVSTSTQDAAAIVGATGAPACVTAGALEDAGAGEAAGAAGFAAGFCATAGAENVAAATNSAQQSVDERMEGLPKARHYTEGPREHRVGET